MARKKTEDHKKKEEIFRKTAAVIEKQDVDEFVSCNFLPFSWSVVLDRALVNTNDGLKPIQRRILYTAHKLGITDKSAKIKSVNFEGRVTELSPHGGCYSSIVNIAESESPGQPRDIRIPLIRGKGSWGTLDSEAAAARYTEMNLWPAAMELLKEIPEDTVDMVPNYDNSQMEPINLPARWPVAIINGVPNAMAVGFACNIPSHNPDEIMDACIAYVQNENIDIKELLKIVKGPDFNCGCDIISDTIIEGKPVNGIKNYLTTGKGTFVMNGKYELEDNNGEYKITFYSLPYKIGPEKVIEVVKDKYEKGSFQELRDWKDLSDFKNPVKLQFTTKKGININKVIEDLYKLTPIRSTFAANNTIVKDNIPQLLDIKSIIASFIDFRKVCTTRKLNFRIDKKKKLLQRQEGLLKVTADIDKCIKIIRNSEDEAKAKEKLIKTFKIDEEQADYVLSLQLRKLTKSDSVELKNSIDKLKKEIAEIDKILKNKKEFTKFLVSELEDTKKVISSPRKCKIMKSIKNDLEDEEKDIFININQESNKIKRTFDSNNDSFHLEKDGRVGVITKDKMFIRSVYEIPDNKEVVMSRFSCSGKPLTVCGSEGYLLLVGKEGMAKIVDLNTYKYPRKDSVDKLLPQQIEFANVYKNLDHQLIVGAGAKEVKVNFTDIPMRSISAGGKKILNTELDYIEVE